MNYRADIDGLRSIAVLPVILFHFNITTFSGGFVGVDIFFVISGFLITRILAENCRYDRFSLLNFYSRRIKRIFPVLFVVVLATLVAGYLILSPGDYETAAESAIFTVSFLSNVFFWLNTGYFDASAETMPLLHTWSLGVEEQFYIVWPLLIFGLWKLTRLKGRIFWCALTGVSACSFVACVVITTYDPEQVFYLPWFRAWQFTMGAMIGFLPLVTRGNHALSVIGISLIAYAVFGFDQATPFPGYSALIPTLGASLIIASGPSAFVNRALSFAPFVGLGLISYSLYLWHWPVTVLYRHYDDGVLSISEISALSAVMITLSIASYFIIERPFRRVRRPPITVIGFGIAGAATVAFASLIIFRSEGVPSRLPEEVRGLASLDIMWEWQCPATMRSSSLELEKSGCVIGSRWEENSRKGVLWGDSHAQHLLPILHEAAQSSDASIIFINGCLGLVDNETIFRHYAKFPNYNSDCFGRQAKFLDLLEGREDIDFLIIANAWTGYVPELRTADGERPELAAALNLVSRGAEKLIERIRTKFRGHIIIAGDFPRPGYDVPGCYMRNASGLLRKKCRDYSEKFLLSETQIQTLSAIENASHHEGVVLWNPSETLCTDGLCPTKIAGEILYRDGNHLRRNLTKNTTFEIINTTEVNRVISIPSGSRSTSYLARPD